MKPIRRSKAKVFACKLAPLDPPEPFDPTSRRLIADAAARGWLHLVEFDAGLDQRLAVDAGIRQ